MHRTTRWLLFALLSCLLTGVGVLDLQAQMGQRPLLGAGGGGLSELPATTCTNQFLRALATDGTGDCDAIAAADLPASVLLSTGSYADPAWLTSLAWAKLTGAPSAVLTTGSYADPAWLTSLAWAKLTGTPSLVTSITGTSNQVVASGSTGEVTLSLPQSIHSGASPTFAGLTLTGGTPGANKLWTSDGSGAGSWQEAPAPGGPGTGTLNRLAFWDSTSSLGSSLLSTDGSTITLTSGTFISPALQVTGGTPGAGKVLTSDGSGVATWQTVSLPASEPLVPPTTNTSDLGSTSNRFKKSYLTAGLDIAQGTLTSNDPAWSSTATWNAGGVTFTHLKSHITDTASAAASLLLDLQVGGTSQFKVDKTGAATATTSLTTTDLYLGGPGFSDTRFNRTATRTASLYGTNQTTLRVHGTAAKFIYLTHNGATDATVGVDGTGSQLLLGTNATALYLTANGPLLYANDNAYDLGASGATRPRTGYFGTSVVTPLLTVSSGTLTTSAPGLNLTQTWNAGGVTFTGLKSNITNTASAAASLLLDLQVGAASKFKVDTAGVLYSANTAGLTQTCVAAVATITVTGGIVTAITCP